MRITGQKPTSGIKGRSSSKNAASGSSAFTPDAAAEDTPAAAATTSAGGLHSMDALLALQEVHEKPQQREQAARYGHSLLDGLEAIRADLLGGQVSSERLEAISTEVAQHLESGDPQLDSVLREIELRVKVELAKLGRFGD